MINKAHMNNTQLLFKTGQSLLLGFLQMHLTRVSYTNGQIYSHQLTTCLSLQSGDELLERECMERLIRYIILVYLLPWIHFGLIEHSLLSSGNNYTGILKKKQQPLPPKLNYQNFAMLCKKQAINSSCFWGD